MNRTLKRETPPPLFQPVAPERNGPAWEQAYKLSAPRALWLTLREVLLQPAETFGALRRGQSLERAGMFFLIMQCCAAVLWTLMIIVFYPVVMEVQPFDPDPLNTLWRYLRLAYRLSPVTSDISGLLVQGLLFGPLRQVCLTGVAATISHAGLRIFGGRKPQAWIESGRALLYVGGACALLRCLPLVGIPLYYIVGWVLATIALRETHELDMLGTMKAMAMTAMVLCLVLMISLLVHF